MGIASLADLLPYIAIGFAAQLVDGALGMAFGVICNTLLVAGLGMPPALASAKVHLVEVFTSGTSGISHLVQRNIDKRLFFGLAVPGVLGGIAGAYLLTSIDASVMKPAVLAYLAAIGVWLLLRGLLYPPAPKPAKHLAPLGAVGGFLDAAGGGGWGPVVTSNLLVQGVEPRKVIGSVSAAEFFLAVAVSATFIIHIEWEDLAGATLGLIVGGMAAAPIGAVMARRIPVKPMLMLVGTVLAVTSAYGIWRLLS